MLRIIVVTALAYFATSGAGLARWIKAEGAKEDPPEIRRWIEGLTDKQGRSCCASADGYRPSEVEYDTEHNHYTALVNGRWIDIPNEAVLTVPNKKGIALLWYYMSGNTVVVRCFLPGSGL
jgi:hypothetical protein